MTCDIQSQVVHNFRVDIVDVTSGPRRAATESFVAAARGAAPTAAVRQGSETDVTKRTELSIS